MRAAALRASSLIDADGVVRWIEARADYTDSIEVDDVLAAIDAVDPRSPARAGH
jgi:alkyl hydroperoxide reductase subunit AhpC